MSYLKGIDLDLAGRALDRLSQPATPERQSGWRRVGDIPLELASGVARGVKFTADAFGAGNAVSEGAGAVDEFARSLLSAQAKADDQQIAQIMAAAQDAGVWEQVKAAAQAFATSPIRQTVNALGTSVPTIAATMIPGVGQAGAVARVGMLAGMGGVQGAGVVKGSIYEAVKAEMLKDGATAEEAEAAAIRAQEYGGANTDSIVGGAALGAGAMATGFQPAAARMLNKQPLLARALQEGSKKPGVLRRAGTGVLKEVPLEAAQGGQEQLASNVALQREGFTDIPTFRGVAGSAALEGMAAAPGGAVFGALEKPTRLPQLSEEEIRRKAADLALNDIAKAKSTDEALTAFAAATNVPLLPTGEAIEYDVLPTPDVAELEEIPTGEATEVQPNLVLDNQLLVNKDRTFREKSDALRRKLGKPAGVEATELLPTGEATEVENIPTPDVFEDIPTPEAAEVLPVGEASEVIPTAEVIEPTDAVPAGEATDIEPEQADTALLLTNDGMPYGTLSGAKVRARREGLPPEAVVEVQGGWAVKKEPEGGPAQPDVPGTPAVAGRAGAPGSAVAGGSGAPVGRVAADGQGNDPRATAGPAPSRPAPQPVGDGLPADPALRIKALSKQWADAVARGDMAEAKRLNDLIVEARKPSPAPPAPAPEVEKTSIPAVPATDTREQAIRRAWDSEPRTIGEWTPMTVAVGEGDQRRTNDMLVIQRKARTQGNGALTMRVLRTGRLLASDDPQPLMFTFKLTEANKVEQVGRARVPTAEDIAQWEGAGFTVPGKKAEAPKPAKPAEKSKPAPAQDTPVPGAEVAPATGRDVMPEGLVVSFAGRSFKVKSVEEAQAKWIEFRDTSGAGVSQIGNGIRVTDGAGRFVARISYNGRLWDSDNPATAKLLAEAPDSVPPSETVEAESPAPAPAVEKVSTPPAPAPAPEPAPAPTNPPAPAAQTRPERLIELRKRQSVLKQLLECLG
jgi:hypothetical protein